MNRRNFIITTGILSSFTGLASSLLGENSATLTSDPLNPVLLPALLPLEHNGGLTIRTRISSKMTNGLYSNVETAVAPKTMGPPPHFHKELDELMYVQEGTASILIGDEIVEVGAGGWHLRPRLIKHTFWNGSDVPLRFIDMYFNQPFEEYLERIFHELTEEHGFKEGSEEKIREINLLNEKFGVVFPTDAFEQQTEIMKRFTLK